MTKFLNKRTCFIGKNVKIGKNVTIYENNHIDGDTYIGDDSIILPNNFLLDCTIGNNCKIHNSVIEKSTVGNNCNVGPFSHIRPNSKIGNNCKIGNFVEIKNSNIGDDTKASHLSYIGDADIGKNCNIGCGVIFANYNGKVKNKTYVGNHVFIGSNSNLIAPLKIEDDSYICAGTTITENVEKEDFVIGRVKQENKQKRAKKYW